MGVGGLLPRAWGTLSPSALSVEGGRDGTAAGATSHESARQALSLAGASVAWPFAWSLSPSSFWVISPRSPLISEGPLSLSLPAPPTEGYPRRVPLKRRLGHGVSAAAVAFTTTWPHTGSEGCYCVPFVFWDGSLGAPRLGSDAGRRHRA